MMTVVNVGSWKCWFVCRGLNARMWRYLHLLLMSLLFFRSTLRIARLWRCAVSVRLYVCISVYLSVLLLRLYIASKTVNKLSNVMVGPNNPTRTPWWDAKCRLSMKNRESWPTTRLTSEMMQHIYCGTPIGTRTRVSNGLISNDLEWPLS